MTAEKPVYHQSALSQFEFCAHAYYLDHIEGRRGLGNMFLARGNGVHAARRVNLRQKVRTYRDLALPPLLDVARDEVNRQVAEGRVDLHCEELDGLGPQAAAGRIIDSTRRLVEVDHWQLQRTIQPQEVEVKKAVTLAQWPFDLAMTLDSIDVDCWITDLKTSRTKWTQQRADDEYQPSVYWLGYRAHFGRNPYGFRHHCITASTARTGRVLAYTLRTSRTDAQILAVLERFNAMHAAIGKGVFPPAHQSSWKCSPKWCQFYRMCKYVQR